jgi:hypothetical protein
LFGRSLDLRRVTGWINFLVLATVEQT